jgi:ABC-2 type transport system ATP-binding protein
MPVIRTRELSKSYFPGIGKKRVDALRGLTMAVEEHEIFGFLGPNGAGKTTTMKILMGLIRPTGGDAEIFGRPAGDTEAKRKLGFLPEQPYFYDHLSGREILDYFGRLFGLSAGVRRTRSAELLERVGLAAAADQPLRGYSKGMLQRIGIAQALINDPQLVVLDEPMSGLDPIGRKEVRDLILRLRAEKRTVFFSTHILSDVESVCDRVAILDKGKVVALSPLHELLARAGSEVEIVAAGGSGLSDAIAAKLPGAKILRSGDRTVIRIAEGKEQELAALVASAGAKTLTTDRVPKSLEAIFMDLVTAPKGAA